MEVTNTLAYYDTSTITAIKSLIVQAPGLFDKGVTVPGIDCVSKISIGHP
jgi:hypothetical protein